jgi:Family of unknown function (DUF6445)
MALLARLALILAVRTAHKILSAKPMHDSKIRIIQHGNEHETVIIIDDFVADPDQLIAAASMLSFSAIGLHYPGVRAPVPPFLAARCLNSVLDLIVQTFALSGPPAKTETYFSLVTTQPQELEPIQRLPHFDGVEKDRIAVLHFLGKSEAGGTAFFRHLSTGFETVNAERLVPFTSSLEQDITHHGIADEGYICGDTSIYAQIAHYEALYNRAIIYRGNTLHCANIPDGMALPNDPETGRLTVNTFLNVR